MPGVGNECCLLCKGRGPATAAARVSSVRGFRMGLEENPAGFLRREREEMWHLQISREKMNIAHCKTRTKCKQIMIAKREIHNVFQAPLFSLQPVDKRDAEWEKSVRFYFLEQMQIYIL